MFKFIFSLIRWYFKSITILLTFMGIIVLSMVFSDLVGMSADYFSIIGTDTFWKDANQFASGIQTSTELESKYGDTFIHIAEQAFWMFYPSEKTITFRMNMSLAIDGSLQSNLILMILMYFLLHYSLRSMAKLYCGAHDLDISFFTSRSWKEKISFIFSMIIVFMISLLNASFEHHKFNIGIQDLAFIYFVQSYTSALLFLAIKYAIDCYYIKQQINPHTIFKDDFIAIFITLILLGFYGNSPLSIISELIAGAAPFLIFKIKFLYFSQNVDNDIYTEKSTYNTVLYEYALGFCFLIFWVSLAFRFVLFGAILTDSLEGYETVRYEIWNTKLWNSYLEEKTHSQENKYLHQLLYSKKAKHKNTIATIYAIRGKKKLALSFANKAIPETLWRVKMLLQGIKPKQVEKIIEEKNNRTIKEKIRFQQQENIYKKINSRLWRAYLANTAKISKKEVYILSKSTNKSHLDTVATIYAWKRKRKLAEKFAKIALKNTKLRVKLLLSGMEPKQVELQLRRK